MQEYTNKITLTKNGRGVYSLDPSMGCYSGLKNNKKGCYNDCYAARYSKKYGYDFSKTVLRYFENESHKHRIIKEISKVPMPFIRMGTSGDPSEDWAHTLSICKIISTTHQLSLFPKPEKEIIIITKHWTVLTNEQLKELSTYNVCINTSVSALDEIKLLDNALEQFERLKPFCKSILRVVSCDFNLSNKKGLELSILQKSLFSKGEIIDTILRVNPKNEYVTSGLIHIKETKFLGKKCYVSKYNRKAYFGNCSNCLEMCGAKMETTKNQTMEDIDKRFALISTRIDVLFAKKELTGKEQLELTEIKEEWNDIINRQEINHRNVTSVNMPYAI